MTDTISCSVVKRDHLQKAEGRSLYVGDYSSASDGRSILTGKLLHSEKARAKILSVRVPPLPEGYFYVDALAISRVSFAGVFREEEGRIANLSAVFGAVADTVLRFRDLEAMLVGKTPDEARELKEAFLTAYSDRLKLEEGRVSAAYRKAVCLNLVKAFLEKFGI